MSMRNKRADWEMEKLGFISPGRAATVASRHFSTVLTWARKGLVKSFRVGPGLSQVYIERKSLEDILGPEKTARLSKVQIESARHFYSRETSKPRRPGAKKKSKIAKAARRQVRYATYDNRALKFDFSALTPAQLQCFEMIAAKRDGGHGAHTLAALAQRGFIEGHREMMPGSPPVAVTRYTVPKRVRAGWRDWYEKERQTNKIECPRCGGEADRVEGCLDATASCGWVPEPTKEPKA